jgi:acyl-coenzyme A thioesterase PaaI-like protein
MLGAAAGNFARIRPKMRESMTEKAIQDFYADDVAICYGCGRHNPYGLHIKSYWDGREGVCHFKPEAHHTAFPGVVYGGLIASVIDCHCIAAAHAAAYQAEGRELGTEPEMTFVTGTLKVTYLHATPIDAELSLRAGIKEMHEKKIVITCSVFADGKQTAQGEVTAIRAPRDMRLLSKA